MTTRYPVSAETQSQITNRFTHHAPHGDQAERYEMLRTLARNLATSIVMVTPQSREQSLALTKLEEVVFFANAAIARNEDRVGAAG